MKRKMLTIFGIFVVIIILFFVLFLNKNQPIITQDNTTKKTIVTTINDIFKNATIQNDANIKVEVSQNQNNIPSDLYLNDYYNLGKEMKMLIENNAIIAYVDKTPIYKSIFIYLKKWDEISFKTYIYEINNSNLDKNERKEMLNKAKAKGKTDKEIWDSIIKSVAISNEAKRLNFTATKIELQNEIKANITDPVLNAKDNDTKIATKYTYNTIKYFAKGYGLTMEQYCKSEKLYKSYESVVLRTKLYNYFISSLTKGLSYDEKRAKYTAYINSLVKKCNVKILFTPTD